MVEGGEQSNAPADTEHQAHHHHHHHHEEEEESTGLDLPTRAHQHGSSGPKRFIGDTKPDQGFGQRNHHKGGAATEVTKKEEELVKPAEIKKEKQVTEEWSTMKDPVQERKNAEDAKRKQQKEKEAAVRMCFNHYLTFLTSSSSSTGKEADRSQERRHGTGCQGSRQEADRQLLRWLVIHPPTVFVGYVFPFIYSIFKQSFHALSINLLSPNAYRQ